MTPAGRLPALLKGDERPTDVADRVALAQLCYDTKRYCAGGRGSGPRPWRSTLKLGDDRRAQRRYNAARAAAMAAAGKGVDEPPLDDGARLRFAPGRSAGCGPSSQLGRGSSDRASPRTGRKFSSTSGTPGWTSTSSRSATRRPWPSSPRPSGNSGRRSGPRSRRCSSEPKDRNPERPAQAFRSRRRSPLARVRRTRRYRGSGPERPAWPVPVLRESQARTIAPRMVSTGIVAKVLA